MTINNNDKIAIVGYNDAGKSTLIKLLAGLYKPTSGIIMVDNTNINDLSPEQYYKHIKATFQDHQIYATKLLKML